MLTEVGMRGKKTVLKSSELGEKMNLEKSKNESIIENSEGYKEKEEKKR